MTNLYFRAPGKWRVTVFVAAVIVVLSVVLVGWDLWYPLAGRAIDRAIGVFRAAEPGAAVEHARSVPGDATARDAAEHAGHDHAGHDETTSLFLSRQALSNVGLTEEHLRPVEFTTFRKSITVPAVVVERPGRTRVEVATPMTGVMTHVHAVEGEAVEPGTLLFRIRLTHEDLVQAQTDFLTTLGELDVEEREIERLSEIASSGAIAGKSLLERQYAKDRLTAVLRAQREALRLHGLSEEQVEQIAQQRRLLRELQVLAPSADDHGSEELRLSRRDARQVAWVQDDAVEQTPLVLQRVNVHKGQAVEAGETLCILADYSSLYVEGLAFEQDIMALRKASEHGWSVEAIFDQPDGDTHRVQGLDIAYLANAIEADSRTLSFYVRLPNQITKRRVVDGNVFVEWMYLPGQRLQLRVPVAEWPEQIVLPVDAVAREGAEYFVFQQNGDHFDRVPVHVRYRDQYAVVVENDGAVFPGDVLAMRGAHQLQMALKNKAGGGVDPHAGHNH